MNAPPNCHHNIHLNIAGDLNQLQPHNHKFSNPLQTGKGENFKTTC
jgi:hypothetical protein